ncbi:hypothetical protein [Cellulomonas sp. ATA003]|uniref:hypothetical protein n=1 Tax=Cellulomonas sp. ATA003 TaxID=3073064 RepID=UPI002873E901|nr:hypothetical protein [Cellulomonas sp. ATA003]WNB85079.1 hypothetical protein REH70_15620 [Cellulomonas sp. ATA003]
MAAVGVLGVVGEVEVVVEPGGLDGDVVSGDVDLVDDVVDVGALDGEVRADDAVDVGEGA